MKTVLLSALLFLLPSCGVLSGMNDGGMQRQLVETLGAFGDAAVRLEGTRLLNEHAPGLVPMIDSNGDKQVSLQELVDFINMADPAQMIVLGTIFFSQR